jgi:hypothetical protein
MVKGPSVHYRQTPPLKRLFLRSIVTAKTLWVVNSFLEPAVWIEKKIELNPLRETCAFGFDSAFGMNTMKKRNGFC